MENNKLLFELIHEYKEKLKQKTFANCINFYDVLKLCLTKLISGESDNVFDTLKDIRSNGMYSDFCSTEEQTEEHYKSDLKETKAVLELLLQEPKETNENINIQDISTLINLFSSVGEGLNTNEYFKIYLAIKKLITDYPVDSVRFWGKIFGTQHDYYIIECQPDDYDAFQHSEENFGNIHVQERVEEISERVPQLPNSTWKPPLDVPAEEIGEGVNNRVYFVSNHASGPYTLLPLCHPKHITAARMIYSYFTGDLISKVSCWPPFPGTEAQYLRAQIARISSGTLLAPKNFFRILQEEEQNAELSDEEGEIVPTECEENEEYVPQAVEAMRSSDWVHSRPYILPQGRVTWINMKDIEESELDDRKSEETDTVTQLKGLDNEPEKREKGPPILTPITEDLEISGYEPWRLKKIRDESYLLISSRLWPGAHTAAKDGSYENIYIGWGLKATKPHEFPGWLSHDQNENHHEPEEVIDPTPDQEKAKEAAENEEESDDDDDSDKKVEEEEATEDERKEISDVNTENSQN